MIDDNWYGRTFLNLHFDYHTHAGQRAAGRGADPRALRRQLRLVRPDYVQFHAKGAPGYATYPTRAGVPNPHLKRDILRVWRDVTAGLGIRFGVYYSALLDDVQTAAHPEWLQVDPQGRPQPGLAGHRVLCVRSPYIEQVMQAQLREILAWYDVDAFWIDHDDSCFKGCWCPRCRAAWRRQTGQDAPLEPTDPRWPRYWAFQRASFDAYVTAMARMVHELKPGCLYCSNWSHSVWHPDPVLPGLDWLSGDTGGIETSLHGRFLSNRTVPADLMTHDLVRSAWPGNRYAPKTLAHHLREGARILASGCRWQIWINPRPDAGLPEPNMRRAARIAQAVRPYRRLLEGTESAAAVAVLHSEVHYYAAGDGGYRALPCVKPLWGLHWALTHAHVHFDVVGEQDLMARPRPYRLLIVPEQTHLSARVQEWLKAFVRKGGRVVVIGPSPLVRDRAFAGLRSTGRLLDRPGHLAFAGEVLEMTEGHVRAVPAGARVLEWFLTGDDSGTRSDRPAVSRHRFGRGQVTAILTPAATACAQAGQPALAHWLGRQIARALGRPDVRYDGPPEVELFVRQRGSELQVHLVNLTVAEELDGPRCQVETTPAVGPVMLHLRLRRPPREVRLEPGGRRLQSLFADGRLGVRLAAIGLWTVVSVRQ